MFLNPMNESENLQETYEHKAETRRLSFAPLHDYHSFLEILRLLEEPLRLPPRLPLPLQHFYRDKVLQRRRDVLEVLRSKRPRITIGSSFKSALTITMGCPLSSTV